MKAVNKTLTAGLVSAMFSVPAMADDNIVKLHVNGAVEVELGTGEDFSGTKSSDIALATVELGFEAQITDWVSASILMLHEDDDTEPMEVDEGVIAIGNVEATPFSLAAGRMYVPFGAFETNLVSDPLTLEIGETREAAVLVGFDSGISASFFLFNGDTVEAGSEDNIEHFGFSLGYGMESESLEMDFGFSYISSIGDTDGVFDAIEGNTGSGDLVAYVAGMSLHGVINMGPLSLIGEYTAALDTFDSSEIDFNGNGAQPSAYNLEAGYTLGETTFAVAFQGTQEAVGLGLPETRFLIAASMPILEGASLGIEFLTEEDYGTSDGGTGNSGNAFTVQLATEF